MARIYKRGKVWYLDIRVKGRRIRRRVGNSKKVAELALKDAEVKVARDEFGFAREDITIDKLFALFLDYSRANHREATTVRYSTVLDNFQQFVDARAGVTFLSEIASETIERYKIHRKSSRMDSSKNRPKGIRDYTLNFELKALNHLFNLAVQWGYSRENPLKEVKRLKVNDTRKFTFLSKDECQRLLGACPRDLYPIYFTFLSTGMRKSELINLEWDDIDFKRRKLRIQWKEHWQPKSGERDIPMSEPLYDLLLDLKEKNDRGLKSHNVFPHKDGSQIKVKLREKLVEIAGTAGIHGLTKLHTLRHTFASHLVMSGVDLPTVKKLMGHSDIQTTMVYAHLQPDHLEKAVNKLPF